MFAKALDKRKPDPILDRKVMSLTGKGDDITVRDLNEGTFIVAAAGAGKTTCVGKRFAHALLSIPNSGGLVLMAKAEELANWKQYAKDCGRLNDLIIFNAESGHCFDPLHYEFTRPGRGAGDIESVIDFFTTLVAIGKKEAGQSHDPFWERGNEQLMRNTIKLLELAGERVSIASIDKIIKSMPTDPEVFEQEAWQKRSYCAQIINAIKGRKDSLTQEQWSDLDVATAFTFIKWPAFDARPRSSLEMTWSGMADKFMFNPFHRLFCSGKCTFTPEDTTHRGKIVLCDFPMLEYGHETGRTINVILKLIFQRAWLRRMLSDSPNPVFLWQDEFQYFLTRRDNFFQQTCRGSSVAVFCLTQNILNLSEELGEQQPGSKTKSFLGNLALKIFLQQNEIESCNYAADQIGKEWRPIGNFHTSTGAGNAHTSVGGALQLVHIVEPHEFTRLKKPNALNPFAEAIVYQSGKRFEGTKSEKNPDGLNYLRVHFSREV